MITHSAKQNHPAFWVLEDLDGRLLLRLGKMRGEQLRNSKAGERFNS